MQPSCTHLFLAIMCDDIDTCAQKGQSRSVGPLIEILDILPSFPKHYPFSLQFSLFNTHPSPPLHIITTIYTTNHVSI